MIAFNDFINACINASSCVYRFWYNHYWRDTSESRQALRRLSRLCRRIPAWTAWFSAGCHPSRLSLKFAMQSQRRWPQKPNTSAPCISENDRACSIPPFSINFPTFFPINYHSLLWIIIPYLLWIIITYFTINYYYSPINYDYSHILSLISINSSSIWTATYIITHYDLVQHISGFVKISEAE